MRISYGACSQRAPDVLQLRVRHVCVHLRRPDIRVAEEFLHIPNVHAVLEEMRRESVYRCFRFVIAASTCATSSRESTTGNRCGRFA